MFFTEIHYMLLENRQIFEHRVNTYYTNSMISFSENLNYMMTHSDDRGESHNYSRKSCAKAENEFETVLHGRKNEEVLAFGKDSCVQIFPQKRFPRWLMLGVLDSRFGR